MGDLKEIELPAAEWSAKATKQDLEKEQAKLEQMKKGGASEAEIAAQQKRVDEASSAASKASYRLGSVTRVSDYVGEQLEKWEKGW